jgi:hypothetical protein
MVGFSHVPGVWFVFAFASPAIPAIIRWIGVLVARELFARKAPAVRRDLLTLAALDRPEPAARSRRHRSRHQPGDL